MKRGSSPKQGPCEVAVREYFGAILSGEVTACRKMKQVARRIMRDMDAGATEQGWRFSEAHAARAVGFIERFCKLPSGRLGAPFVLELFQRAILSVVFGFVDAAGLRRYREVLWIMGRKNGKTALTSAIELYMLVGDGEGAPEVYNVATAHDQAAKGFDNAWRMVQKSPVLARAVKKRAWDLYCNSSMGTIKALSSNTKSQDGLDISCAVIDELAAIRNRDLYDLMVQGTSARDQPLIFEITTNGFVRDNIFDSQYAYACKWLDGIAEGEQADRFIPFIFELDEREEWTDEGFWIKANPGLGPIKKLSALRKNVSKAKDSPDDLPSLLVKDFNLIENQSSAWLTYGEVHNPETFDPADDGFKYAIAGLDAADTTDLMGACVMMQKPGDPRIYTMHMGWVQRRALDEAEAAGKRGGRDGVPYDKWVARGLLRVCDDPIMDKRAVLDWWDELREKYGIYVIACGYDPWHIRDVPTLDAFHAYLGKDNFQPVRQGAQTLSMPMREIRALYRENQIVDCANPIAEWCRSNVMVKTDVNGNIQPDKKGNDPRNRIDLWAAEIDAFVTLQNEADNYHATIGG